MPGRFDNLSVTMSFMAQIFSFTSILLVPLGLLWMLFGRGKSNPESRSKYFKIVTLIFLTIITLVVSVAPFSQNNASFAIVFLAISFSAIVTTCIGNRKFSRMTNPQSAETPLYLILIPLIVLTARLFYLDKAVQYSRELAIRNSEELSTWTE